MEPLKITGKFIHKKNNIHQNNNDTSKINSPVTIDTITDLNRINIDTNKYYFDKSTFSITFRHRQHFIR